VFLILSLVPVLFTGDVRLPSMGVVPQAEALIAELACLNCHAGSAALERRLAPKRAPALDLVGSRSSPSSLREFLTSPHTRRPGTSMPDMLRALPQAQRAQGIENLVHYLSSRGGPLDNSPFQATDEMLEAGRQTLHEVGCVACHTPEESLGSLGEALQLEKFARDIDPSAEDEDRYVAPGTLDPPMVPFGELAGRTSVNALTEFLLDPVAARPSGRMPSMNLSEPEARNIAVYLLREQSAETGYVDTPGLRYSYYESNFGDGNPKLDTLTPVRMGVLKGDFEDLEDADNLVELVHREDHFAFEFTGTFLLDAAGTYGFRTESDDGSWLYIDGEEVVNNSGFHAVTSSEGNIDLSAGAHRMRIVYFEAGGGSELMVHWSGPDFEERPLRGDDLVYRTLPMRPLETLEFELDPARVARGAALFQSLGCAACHEPEAGAQVATAFSHCDPDAPTGCLSTQTGARVAHYGWSEEQRNVVQEWMRSMQDLAPRSSDERARALLAQNRCYACHRRDDIGGPHPTRGDYFASEPGVDLGEEGRIPPLLDAAGSKLHRPAGSPHPNASVRQRSDGSARSGHGSRRQIAGPPLAHTIQRRSHDGGTQTRWNRWVRLHSMSYVQRLSLAWHSGGGLG
jgi:cytochrome c551/c552